MSPSTRIIEAKSMSAIKQIHVAAAVILDNRGNIFLAKRLSGTHQGGLWEFPGGKVELDESAEQALERELYEELDIRISSAKRFISIPFDYPDKSILLDVFTVNQFEGTPFGKEGQETAWVDLAVIANLEFPEANQPIVAKIVSELR